MSGGVAFWGGGPAFGATSDGARCVPAVPQDPVPSDVLATALCGAAMALGILLALVGLALLVATYRHRHGTWGQTDSGGDSGRGDTSPPCSLISHPPLPG